MIIISRLSEVLKVSGSVVMMGSYAALLTPLKLILLLVRQKLADGIDAQSHQSLR